jgi:hypothetical protein
MRHNLLHKHLDRSHVYTVRYCLKLLSNLHIHISCNYLLPTKTVTPVTKNTQALVKEGQFETLVTPPATIILFLNTNLKGQRIETNWLNATDS